MLGWSRNSAPLSHSRNMLTGLRQECWFYHHDHDEWRTTVCCSDITSPIAKADLCISTARQYDNARRNKKRWTRATTPDAKKVTGKERKRSWRARKDTKNSQSWSTELLASITPCRKTMPTARTKLRSFRRANITTVCIRYAQRYDLQKSMIRFQQQLSYY